MSDLVNVQKEFEELISQLERLKTVNEITSANTESSKKVIQELNLFITKTESYLDKSNQNHLNTDKLIGGSIEALKKSIEKIEIESGKTQENIEERFEQLNKQTEKALSSSFQKIEEHFDKILEVEEKIAKNQATFGINLKSHSETIQTKINSFAKGLNNKYSQQNEQINTLKLLLFFTIALMVIGFAGIVYLGLY